MFKFTGVISFAGGYGEPHRRGAKIGNLYSFGGSESWNLEFGTRNPDCVIFEDNQNIL
jgi:hypothetical protein